MKPFLVLTTSFALTMGVLFAQAPAMQGVPGGFGGGMGQMPGGIGGSGQPGQAQFVPVGKPTMGEVLF